MKCCACAYFLTSVAMRAMRFRELPAVALRAPGTASAAAAPSAAFRTARRLTAGPARDPSTLARRRLVSVTPMVGLTVPAPWWLAQAAWKQSYEPHGLPWWASAAVAATPVAVLFYVLAVRKSTAPRAAAAGA